MDAQDPASIALAIRRLVDDRDAAGSREVRQRIREQYTWGEEERVFLKEVLRVSSERCPPIRDQVSVL